MKTEDYGRLLVEAIQQRINEIVEEECVEASKRVKSRIVADCAGLAPTILRNVDWMNNSSEVVIKISSK